MSTYIYRITPARTDFAEDMTPSEKDAMARHFLYLKKLMAEGKLILAGPCLDAAFGIAIFEADSQEEANRIAKADPAVVEGVMNVEIHEFRISLMRSNQFA